VKLRVKLRVVLSVILGLWAVSSSAQVTPADLTAKPQLQEQEPTQAQDFAQQPDLAADLVSVLGSDLGSDLDSDPYSSLERQIELGEFAPAINELEQQINTIEGTQHRYHVDLIQPLTLLGDAKHGAEDFPGALDAYGRAIHLTRVNSGLHSADQVAGVYREAKVYRSAGDLQQANNREEYAWGVLQKTHGRYSPKLLPGIHHLADWYGQTYNVLSARALYMRAVRIVEANYSEQHPEMVTALRGLAQTYRLEKFPPNYLNNAGTDLRTVTPTNSSEYNSAIVLNRFPQGEKALKRVVRIQQANLLLLEPQIVSAEEIGNDTSRSAAATATDSDPIAPTDALGATNPEALARARQKLIAALVELGDWFLLFERSRVAMQYYTQAEVVNTKLTSDYASVDFSQPRLLHFPTPSDPRPPKPGRRGERKQGFVEVNYGITVRGSVTNLETVNSSPQGLMDYRVRKSMLSSRYRPSFVNGAPVSTQDHTYRHKFNYYPSKPSAAAGPSIELDPPEAPATESEPTTAAATTIE
jgi:hypothetical protein